MAPKRPIGAVVRLYFDSIDPVGREDFIRTPTGRTYKVLGGRVQQRGKHRGRQHLECLVIDDDVPAGATVHHLVWYPRAPRKVRSA